MYAHIVKDLSHVEGCDLQRELCADDCRWSQFHEWLAAPLLASDLDELERQRVRRDALLRGEIPA